MTANTPQSRKARGRRLQQWVVQKLIDILGIDPQDLESRSMGAGGEDIIMSSMAKMKFPYSIECKNQERVNVWSAYEQAQYNANNYEPLVVIKKNHKKPLILIDAEYFIGLNKTC